MPSNGDKKHAGEMVPGPLEVWPGQARKYSGGYERKNCI